MLELLSKLIGHKVDVVCYGASSVRGEVLKVEGGVLFLSSDDQTSYIAVDKIAIVWEVREHEMRAGFVGAPPAK